MRAEEYVRAAEASKRDIRAARLAAEALFHQAKGEAQAQRRVALLGRALELSPYDWRLWLSSGLANLRLGAIDPAISHLAVAVALSGSETGPRVTAAIVALAGAGAPSSERVARAKEVLAPGSKRDGHDPLVAWGTFLCDAYAKNVTSSSVTKSAIRFFENTKIDAADASLAASVACIAAMLSVIKRDSRSDRPDRASAAIGRIAELLENWRKQLPTVQPLIAAGAWLRSMTADRETIGRALAAEIEALGDNRLARIALRIRLEEAESPEKRLQIQEGLPATVRRRAGVDREILSFYAKEGRRAIRRQDIAGAEAWWMRGANEDPASPAFAHNLSLAALARRHPGDLGAWTGRHVDLLEKWASASNTRGPALEMLTRRYGYFAHRIGARLAKGELPGGDFENLAHLWCTEAGGWLACLAGLFREDHSKPLSSHWPELFEHAARPTIRPPDKAWSAKIEPLLDVDESMPGLFHYYLLGIGPASPPGEISARLGRARKGVDGSALIPGSRTPWLARVDEAERILLDESRREAYVAACTDWNNHRLRAARAAVAIAGFQAIDQQYERQGRIPAGFALFVKNLFSARAHPFIEYEWERRDHRIATAAVLSLKLDQILRENS